MKNIIFTGLLIQAVSSCAMDYLKVPFATRFSKKNIQQTTSSHTPRVDFTFTSQGALFVKVKDSNGIISCSRDCHYKKSYHNLTPQAEIVLYTFIHLLYNDVHYAVINQCCPHEQLLDIKIKKHSIIINFCHDDIEGTFKYLIDE